MAQKYTTTTAAEYLGVSYQRVSALVKRGTLVGEVELVEVRRFRKEELDAYKAERALRPKGGPLKRKRSGASTSASQTPPES